MAKRIATNKLTRDNWDEDDAPEEIGIFQRASAGELQTRQIRKAKRRMVGDGPAVPVFQNFSAFGTKGAGAGAPSFSFLGQSKASPNKLFASGASKLNDQDKSLSVPTFNFGTTNSEFGKPSIASPNTISGKKVPSHSPKVLERKLENGTSDSLFKFGGDSNIINTGLDRKSDLPPFKYGLDTFYDKREKPGTFASSTITGSHSNSNTSPSDNNKSSTLPKLHGNGKSGAPDKTQNKLYLTKLKALNTGLIGWVKKHVDENPFVDLNPVFDDYKKYFEEMKKKYKPPSETSETSSSDSQSKDVTAQSDKMSKQVAPLSNSSSPSFNFVSDFFKGSKSPGSQSTTSVSLSSSAEKSVFQFSKSNDKSSDNSTFSYMSSAVPSKSPSDKTSLDSLTATAESPFFDSTSKSTTPASTGSTISDFLKGSNSTAKSVSFALDNPKSSFGGSSSATMVNFGTGTSSVSSTFSFGGTKTEVRDDSTVAITEESDEPPKAEVKEIKEDDALYEKKVKLFYKKDGSWVDKGVGTLFLKKAEEKTQLIIRAFNNLGNILLNIVLNDSIPSQRQGKNNVLIICVPNPPINPKSNDNTPISMLLRVKTSDDADDLLSKIEMYKKSPSF